LRLNKALGFSTAGLLAFFGLSSLTFIPLPVRLCKTRMISNHYLLGFQVVSLELRF